ncbi:MAG: hypothetical protein ORN51_12750, partial [Akkermansiaceae bacterium]|nr:hypothetical protein [Akkermansiaceae bacterium]
VYDKSLEAITGGSNVGSIQENFWGWKNLYSQNIRDFLPLASGCLIKPNTIGMQALGVFGFERSKGNRAMERGRSMGQMVKGAASMLMEVQDQMAAPTAMPIAVRKEFADLLKWSGRIQTDSNGCAEIPLKFPDNLTTWKARVWVLGAGTQVGEGTAEFITSKKLFVRMQAPRFMIERDESVFSAVIQNENDEAKSVNVSLELDGNLLEIVSGAAQSVQIAGHHEMRVDWRVRALQEGEATIRMRAMTQDDGDVVERKMPVKVHGMMRQDAWSRMVSPNEASAKILIDVPEQRRPELSKLTVRYSPTVAGAVVDAIPYLASDGNGCTEQTLNRFVPLMVARKMLQRLKVNLAEIKAMRSSLNPQEIGGSGATAVEWKQWQTNPVFDEVEMEQMTERGIERLGGMQNTDGGWGWFSGFGDASYPHTTSVVVHGLVVAKSLGAKVPDAILASGVHWLIAYEKSQLNALTLHKDREALRRAGKPVPKSNNFEKQQCDATDALVRQVLGGSGSESEGMLDLLYRDRIDLPIYAKCLVGLELMRKGDVVRRDEVVQLVGQFLRHDSENQTAYLDLGDSNPWWNWYGSETEANAWFLKLLSGTRPDSADARGVVKYLVNRRNHGGRWSSTRESAYAIEAIGDYLLASGEDKPEMEVEVLIDGKSLQHQMIRKENLFALNHTVVLKGDLVTTGNHVIEIRRTGKGALYGNAFLDVFTQEDRLRSAGLEVKVSRRLSKLIPDAGENQVPDSRGHLATQQVERFKREVLKDGDHLMSGDRIEVELVVESKNDYEYLIFSDAKGAGFEALDSQGGYVMGENGMSVYRESRDQAVNFFIRALPRGKCSIKYQLRAETPGIYKALPATVDAMYAPELRGNSDDVCLEITQ